MLTGKRPFARSEAGSLASAFRAARRPTRPRSPASSRTRTRPGSGSSPVASPASRAGRFRDVGEIRAALLDWPRWPRLRLGRRRTAWLALAGGLVVAALVARHRWAPVPPPTAGGRGGTSGGPRPAGVRRQLGRGARTITVALVQWPGQMPLVVGNGGLTTQPGSAAARGGARPASRLQGGRAQQEPGARDRRGGRHLADRRRAPHQPGQIQAHRRRGARLPAAGLVPRGRCLRRRGPACGRSRTSWGASRRCCASRPSTRCSSSCCPTRG